MKNPPHRKARDCASGYLATASIRPRRSYVALLLLLTVLASFGLNNQGTPVDAHTGDQSYLYLDVTDETLSGRVEFPFADLREALGLELTGSEAEISEELEANADRLETYASAHVQLGASGTWWPITFSGVTRLDAEQTSDPTFGYAQVAFEAEPPTSQIPRQLDVRLDPFFDDIDDDRDALLLIGNDWEAGVIDNPEEVLVRFAPDSREQTIDLGETSWWRNFTASVSLGLDHIKTGPDHILFVLVLLLPSVLVFGTRWEPTRRFGGALWRVLKIVTMFTVAHTITFTLAGLDVLPLPSPRLTESVIALSIAVAAAHNLRPVLLNREWLLAFAFGLFHGMGFASLVSGLDVSPSTQLVSLLGRNVGIEVGQAIVVLLVFPGLFLLRRTRWYSGLLTVGSIGLIVVSIGWMTERLFDAQPYATDLVDRVFSYPRILFLTVIFTAVAFALQRFEASKDRLLPVADEPQKRIPTSIS